MSKYDNYCLAFLDVLGQKDSFKVNGEYVDTLLYKNQINQQEFLDKLTAAHRDTASKVEQLRGLFEEFNSKQIESALNSKTPQGVPEEEYRKCRTYNLEWWNIADSILIATQISDLGEKDRALLTNIYRVFISCEFVMSMSFFLKKAIRGELVPQDPNDEPAEILLKRIKAGVESK